MERRSLPPQPVIAKGHGHLKQSGLSFSAVFSAVLFQIPRFVDDFLVLPESSPDLLGIVSVTIV